MAELGIKTELDNLAYTPGETLRGEVSWQDVTGLGENSESGEVRLFYYTSGKGDRDVETVDTRTIDIQRGSGQQSFEFVLPHEPYSFSGKLVSLIWALEFQVLESKKTERLEFVLSPSGKEIDLYANAEGKMPSYSHLRIGK
ncbi:MAG: hypothetical protein L3J39_07090 [Verrucomicrobiales bacterium]|nr:hypothetical protein [Verrucomicrobiales bacterium]